MNLPLAGIVFFHRDVGDDHAIGVVCKSATGRRIERGDFLDRVLHIVEVYAETTRDVGNTTAGKKGEVIAHDPGGERIGTAFRRKLGEETFLQARRTNSRLS